LNIKHIIIVELLDERLFIVFFVSVHVAISGRG